METNSSLEETLRRQAESLGADYFGIADLAVAQDSILAQGGPGIARFPSGIVIGIALPDTLVDLLAERELPASAILYRHHAYEVANAVLDQAALRLASTVQQAGFSAFPVPASKRTDNERICGFFSHKCAVNLAGLGWIGRSCLLITPDHGPRVRWVTVLTDAPLNAGTPMESQCGECHECVDICPVKAFTGRDFNPAEPREARYDAAACDRYFREMEHRTGTAVCGLCLYICPYGRKQSSGPKKT